MRASQFERVVLADGREGVVVDVYVEPPGYEVEFSSKETGDLWTEGVELDSVVQNLGPAATNNDHAA